MVGYIGFVALVPHWIWRFSLDPSFPFQKYIAIATLIGFAACGFRGIPLTRTAKYAMGCLLAFLSVSYISSFQSINPERSWFFIDTFYKEALMVCVGIRLLDSPRILEAAVVCIILGVSWNAYEINMDYLSKGYSFVNRDGWAYQNMNGYALILLLSFFLTISAALHVSKLHHKAFLLMIAGVNMHAIYIGEARGTMLGCVFSAVLLVYFMEKNLSNWGVIFSTAILGLALAGPSVVKEFSSSFAVEDLDKSAQSRFYIWDAGIRITLDYPVLGLGPWAAGFMVPSYYADPAGTTKETIHLHNLPLEVSTGMGLPGLFLYLGIFFLPWNQLRKMRRNLACVGHPRDTRVVSVVTLAFLAGIPGYWLASCFNSGALIEIPYVFVALAIAAINVFKQVEWQELAYSEDAVVEEEIEDAEYSESFFPEPVVH